MAVPLTEVTTCTRPAVSRIRAGLLANRRVLAGYRPVGQHVADADRRAASFGGLECLQAAPVAPPGDRNHSVRILVHRACLCAEAAVGRSGALRVWPHRASTSS